MSWVAIKVSNGILPPSKWQTNATFQKLLFLNRILVVVFFSKKKSIEICWNTVFLWCHHQFVYSFFFNFKFNTKLIQRLDAEFCISVLQQNPKMLPKLIWQLILVHLTSTLSSFIFEFRESFMFSARVIFECCWHLSVVFIDILSFHFGSIGIYFGHFASDLFCCVTALH